MGMQRSEVMDLELAEALHYVERLNEQREKEAAAIRDAHRKR